MGGWGGHCRAPSSRRFRKQAVLGNFHPPTPYVNNSALLWTVLLIQGIAQLPMVAFQPFR